MNKLTILLVDDEQDLLSLWTLRLKSAGYNVVTAESGEAAMGLFQAVLPNLVITDLRMGQMDGMALYDAIRKLNKTVPVIIITAHGSITEAVDATRQGVYSFLPKPIDGRKLLQEIEKALAVTTVPPQNSDLASWRQGLISQSTIMEELLAKVQLIAGSMSSVLIRGESGTGKELLAVAIHKAGNRADKPFIPVNCSAIPEALMESELFGHVRGSFTGATKNHPGLFMAAQRGTLFLDEIGDMPQHLQVKLLRVLQERIIRPVGGTKDIPIDVRIISATHQNLENAIKQKTFREDLYYRLNVVMLELPPLRDRREDIPLLVNHFILILNQQNERQITGFSPDAMNILLEAAWPGNVRQLFNVVEQATALSTTPLIPSDLLHHTLKEEPIKILGFDEAKREFEQRYLVQLLQTTRGNVAWAARIANRNRTDFYKILNRHNIVPSLFKN
ncbi:sigma 54-interacting transcriptional regulator [Desulfotalea psychrophila]|nr:sigma 54-interacting transcriptional regulator [Desulfocapsa sp.]MBN4065331.1 sigma 54-interacting transcriptional regulator [Desulfocapsa sp. AH-315-G09]MBN4071643.1 sigma 54-interacting transcriptional regulator [Desulfotalea psychrophila]